MRATLTIIGLYEYDPTLFDGFVVPQSIEKDVLIENMLMELGELEIVYTDLEFFKYAIGVWSRKCSKIWEKIDTTLNLSYNPIENFDKFEEVTTTGKGTGNSNGTMKDKNTSTGNSTGTSKSRAFETNSMEINSENLGTSGGSSTVDSSSQNSNTFDNSGTLTSHVHGNVGVTTSQQMIESELKLNRFNLYDYIIRDFKNRFCIMVY